MSGLFKKKKTRGGSYTNLAVVEEEGEGVGPPESPKPQYRVLDAKAKFEAKVKPDVKVKPKSSRGHSHFLPPPKVLGSKSSPLLQPCPLWTHWSHQSHTPHLR